MEIRERDSLKNKKSNIFPNENDESSEELKDNLQNNEYTLNYLRNNYPENILGKLKYNFFDDVIEPDFLLDFDGCERYFFCDLDKLENQFNSMFDKTMEQNPFLFESIKEDLINYSKEFQIDIYQEKNLGTLENIYKNIYYIFSSEKNDKDINNRNNAKRVAYLLTQIKYLKELKNIKLGFISSLRRDLKEKGFKAYNFTFLKEIISEIENMRSSNEEEYINLLENKTNDILSKINLDKNNSEKHKLIFTIFLIYHVNKKLLDKEESIYTIPFELLKKMYKFRQFINNKIIQYGFKSETNKKFFFDIEFSRFKIIRDTNEEKEIFLENGKILNDFFLKLLDDFNYNIKQILSFDEKDSNNEEKEENLSFFRKYLKNFEKQDDLLNECQRKIDELEKQKIKNAFNAGKSIFQVTFVKRKGFFEFFGKKPDDKEIQEENSLVQNAVLSSKDIKIMDREIEKLKKIIKNVEINKEVIIKLIKEYDLKTQIETIMKNRNFIGVFINQKINDIEDHFRDKYTVCYIN